MKKLNCWEVMKCGRELGGSSVATQGVCPAAAEDALDGVHGGVNGGRTCWVLAGTFCGGEVAGTVARKIESCKDCVFFKQVVQEEKDETVSTASLIRRLHRAGRLD